MSYPARAEGLVNMINILLEMLQILQNGVDFTNICNAYNNKVSTRSSDNIYKTNKNTYKTIQKT